MNEFIFGFSTGLSLILAIGAQNLFVIEQGIKKNNIFLVTSICIVGDFLLIFFGIFIFHFIKNFINDLINLLLSIGLVLFLLNFIWSKIKTFKHDSKNEKIKTKKFNLGNIPVMLKSDPVSKFYGFIPVLDRQNSKIHSFTPVGTVKFVKLSFTILTL